MEAMILPRALWPQRNHVLEGEGGWMLCFLSWLRCIWNNADEWSITLCGQCVAQKLGHKTNSIQVCQVLLRLAEHTTFGTTSKAHLRRCRGRGSSFVRKYCSSVQGGWVSCVECTEEDCLNCSAVRATFLVH